MSARHPQAVTRGGRGQLHTPKLSLEGGVVSALHPQAVTRWGAGLLRTPKLPLTQEGGGGASSDVVPAFMACLSVQDEQLPEIPASQHVRTADITLPTSGDCHLALLHSNAPEPVTRQMLVP